MKTDSISKKLLIRIAWLIPIIPLTAFLIHRLVLSDFKLIISIYSGVAAIVAVVIAAETLMLVLTVEKQWRKKESSRVLVDHLAIAKCAEVKLKNELMTSTRNFIDIRAFMKNNKIKGRTINNITQEGGLRLYHAFNDYMEKKAAYQELRAAFDARFDTKGKSTARGKQNYKELTRIVEENGEFYKELNRFIQAENNNRHIDRKELCKLALKCKHLRNKTRDYNRLLEEGTKIEMEKRFEEM